MGRVDQRVDALAAQIFGEALGAAEPADANRNGLRQWLRRAAGERQRHGEIVAGGEDAGQLSGLRRAAKNEDALDAR